MSKGGEISMLEKATNPEMNNADGMELGEHATSVTLPVICAFRQIVLCVRFCATPFY